MDPRKERVHLKLLRLDSENARFGPASSKSWEQAEILDHIVQTFGVDDVLSSLAINGYMAAEPLVCRRDAGSEELTVVEGNRRLAACLIISGDERASRQKTRTQHYQKIWKRLFRVWSGRTADEEGVWFSVACERGSPRRPI